MNEGAGALARLPETRSRPRKRALTRPWLLGPCTQQAEGWIRQVPPEGVPGLNVTSAHKGFTQVRQVSLDPGGHISLAVDHTAVVLRGPGAIACMAEPSQSGHWKPRSLGNLQHRQQSLHGFILQRFFQFQ